MLETTLGFGGMVVAPHHLAAQAGADVLDDGGNAIEAMVAAAATIAVVYPHMNGLGGDNFWLIQLPGHEPLGIDACGAAAGLAHPSLFKEQGLDAIPARGPLAAITVAGAVSGWQRALEISASRCRGGIPLARLLEPAIHHARTGFPMTSTLVGNIAAKHSELQSVPGFEDTYHTNNKPRIGERLRQPTLALTLDRLSQKGFDDFYRGEIAKSLVDDLAEVGSPLRRSDFEDHKALEVIPLRLEISGNAVFNMPPPTQGLASLILLGVFDRLGVERADSFEFVHGIVEATKCAFRIRDNHIADPSFMSVDPTSLLDPGHLDSLAAGIDRRRASPWPAPSTGGDTVWLGAIDAEGRCVSFIQSLYWEFGSGIVLPGTGVTWQNRGTSFSLDENHHNCIQPLKRPFHTIQPALAKLNDGRVMVFGTMGGDGQPQTQATIFSRHAIFGQPLQQSITAPRWLLGRTWGQSATSLRIEGRFGPEICKRLSDAGHPIDVVSDFDEIMGHAGALVLHPNSLMEGAADPRSDGRVVPSRQ